MNRKLLVIIALVAIFAIVAYESQAGKFDWSLFLKTIKDMNWGWLMASFVATFLSYLVRAIRWQVLLDHEKEIGLESSLTATLVGFSAIYVLGRAGEPVGPVWLARRERVSISATGATWLIQRFLDLVMLGLLFTGTLMVVELPAGEGTRQIGFMQNFAAILMVMLVVGTIAMLYFRSNIDRIVAYIPVKKIAALLHSIAGGLSFLHNGRNVVLTLVHSLVLWIVIALQFWFMMLGMKFDFTFAASTLVMVAGAIGSVVSIPGVGGGFQVAMVFCMVTFFGITTERSVAAALVSYALSYLPTLVISALYMLYTGISWKDIRGLETT